MTNRHIFHLAIPVKELDETKDFYLNVLGATIGRENEKWLDILMWGHQITLHNRPDEVLAKDEQGMRHFGVVLPWEEWKALAASLQEQNSVFLAEPEVKYSGEVNEQAKMFLQDPSNNIIEMKAYRNFDKVFGLI